MGVTYKQGKIMKNIYKSFALLCMGLAATACIEENFENNDPKYDTTPGNEIVFSATAGIESGDKKTRTVYGDQDDPTAAKGWIEINWVNGDMIAITSPQSGGPKVGHYKVTGADQDNPETTDKNEADDFNSTHAAASLTRLGDGGLQWSEETKYTFYAAYPSFAYDTDKSHGAKAELTEDGVLTGSMPIDQNYTLTGDSANGWVAAPDMRYSFMTASMTDYDRTDEDAAINLEFKSMVTALQFDIKPNTINTYDAVTNDIVQEMEVISVSLSSDKNITGEFKYDISDPTSYEGTKGTGIASLHFDKDPKNPVKLISKGGSLNVTFFILPEDFTEKGSLQLQIIFKLGNTQMSRIATINANKISGGKKYIFNNVLLPEFTTEDVPSSSWWDALDPDTILPQVSIPVAANVFANPSYLTSIGDERKQQTHTLDQLWAMGVRGFEIQTQSCTAQGDTPDASQKKSLGDEGIVAAGQQLNYTFGKAFDELAGLLMQSKDSNGLPTECLFVICTYSAMNDGYNPYVFISNLFNYLTAYCSNNTRGITIDNFKQINDATTVGDLRGKIAIIIRPGDDDRWLYETTEYKANTSWLGNNATPLTNPYTQLGIDAVPAQGLTAYIPEVLKNDWWNRVMMIADWGAESYDIWDRRYGTDYARAATFNDKCVDAGRQTAKEQIETYLYQTSTQASNIGANSTTGYTWIDSNNFPEPLDEFLYEHSMYTGAVNSDAKPSKAYVQEWMRVIPDGGLGPIAYGSSRIGWGNNYETLWFNWPSSISYKERDIKNLFEKVVKTKGQPLNDLYINVLSGYYADNGISQSFYPYKERFNGESESFEPSNPGKGGNFAGLAADLNQYTYNLLNAEIGAKNGLSQSGPWGLVMMDHIKANDVSAELVELIMMNNFKFPLVTKDGVTPATYNATYSNGGEAISFK